MVVIFRFVVSPVTILTGKPAASARAASSVAAARPSPAAMAAASTSVRNACGVCARNTRALGIVRSTTTAGPPASSGASLPCRSRAARPAPRPASQAASMVRSTRSADANGRAASCTTTRSTSSADHGEPVGDRVLAPRAADGDRDRTCRARQSRPADSRPDPAAARRRCGRRAGGWRTAPATAAGSAAPRSSAVAWARRRRDALPGRRRR